MLAVQDRQPKIPNLKALPRRFAASSITGETMAPALANPIAAELNGSDSTSSAEALARRLGQRRQSLGRVGGSERECPHHDASCELDLEGVVA